MRTVKTLSEEFYSRDAISVARDLLGHRLIHWSHCGAVVGGTIVETEAYCGVGDRACHAFAFRRTDRTDPMYGPPGTAYVYRIYGLHHCLNVVTLRRGSPHAVLLRGVVPQLGLSLMAKRRQKPARKANKPNAQLTDGPGKLCQAMEVDTTHNGTSFLQGPLYIEQRAESQFLRKCTAQSRRVGLGQVGEFDSFLWRFSLNDEVLEHLLCQTETSCT